LIAFHIILNNFFNDFSFLTLKIAFVKIFKGVQFTHLLNLAKTYFTKLIPYFTNSTKILPPTRIFSTCHSSPHVSPRTIPRL